MAWCSERTLVLLLGRLPGAAGNWSSLSRDGASSFLGGIVGGRRNLRFQKALAFLSLGDPVGRRRNLWDALGRRGDVVQGEQSVFFLERLSVGGEPVVITRPKEGLCSLWRDCRLLEERVVPENCHVLFLGNVTGIT